MKKTVLIFGAGKGQVPIIKKFQDNGCYVIAVSPNGNYPGLSVADEIIFEDVNNVDRIISCLNGRKIDVVASDQMDIAVPLVAQTAHRLGLKGIPENVALRFSNKFEMRNATKVAGVNVPRFEIINEVDHAIIAAKRLIGYPCMIKPVDNDSSKGVFKINNEKELIEKFELSKGYSKVGSIIIEQFITGKEYVVEAFTKDYITTNLIVGHRDYFDIPNTFIPSATVFIDATSADSHIENKVKEANLKLVESFGLPFGITHGEFLYNEKDDEVYLVEIAARGGGVFISSDLIPAACGIDALDLLVKELLNTEYEKRITLRQGAAGYFCFLTKQGVVECIEGIEEIKNQSGVIKAYFDNISIGMRMNKPIDKSSRKGPILVKGKTKEDCYAVYERIKSRLIIRIRDGKELTGVIWH